MKEHFIGSFLLAGVLAAGLHAQNLNRPDQRFVQLSALAGMAQVKLGQLAEEKGASQAVKDFGARMVADHNKVDDRLKDIASSNGVTISDELRPKDQAIYDRLSKLSGAQFDREYLRAAVLAHELDLAAYRRESQSAADPAVRDFATNALAEVEEHLRIARDGTAKFGISAAK